MDLSTTTFFKYHEHFKQISETLSDREAAKELFDAARRDTPIIDGMFVMLDAAVELPEEDDREAAFGRVMRDIHIVLALRGAALEAKNETQVAAEVAAKEIPFHLRRASEN